MDLSVQEQENLSGGQVNPISNRTNPPISSMPPGYTMVVPDMIVSIPPKMPDMTGGGMAIPVESGSSKESNFDD
ncbi:hypothetical protein B6N60_01028 [Richelia sinica FACHB-800]|uniref:Uncharacterized protein n=1 Tax=Richelia sinica FACHB-800 TaxID=1357546 RepID=A0A975T597_9NOST|nr:hypothetical protein B6N60_01028 [Richelia sinica FACHB-800]